MNTIRTLLVACSVVWLAAALAAPSPGQEYSAYGNPITGVTLGKVLVQAEVVASPERLYLGLSHRPSLAEGQGMLFLMPEREVQHFCMRGMRFAIDIIWIVDGQVAGIEQNVSPTDDRTLTSPVPVNVVLEVPGGWSERHGVKVGVPVRF